PFGNGHFLLGSAPGWVQNAVGKWQLGGIMNFITGQPLSFTTGNGTISTTGAAADIVGSLPRDIGNVTKLTNGVTYFNGYSIVNDPGLSQVSPACVASTTACNGMLSGYTNKAIQASNGQTVLMNPQPGGLGTLGWNTVKGPRTLNFDMDLIKRFRI